MSRLVHTVNKTSWKRSLVMLRALCSILKTQNQHPIRQHFKPHLKELSYDRFNMYNKTTNKQLKQKQWQYQF